MNFLPPPIAWIPFITFLHAKTATSPFILRSKKLPPHNFKLSFFNILSTTFYIESSLYYSTAEFIYLFFLFFIPNITNATQTFNTPEHTFFITWFSLSNIGPTQLFPLIQYFPKDSFCRLPISSKTHSALFLHPRRATRTKFTLHPQRLPPQTDIKLNLNSIISLSISYLQVKTSLVALFLN